VRALEWLGEAARPWAVERIHRTPLFFLGADFDRRNHPRTAQTPSDCETRSERSSQRSHGTDRRIGRRGRILDRQGDLMRRVRQNITTRRRFWLENKRHDARAAIERRGKEKTMSPKAPKKGSKVMSAPRRAQKPMSREARAMYAELQRGVRHLEGSVGEIQRGLRNAERKLEADARAQIRELRKDARTHLSVLKSKQREAAATLERLSTAAGGSWADIKRTVDSILVDARATATAAVERFRSALGG